MSEKVINFNERLHENKEKEMKNNKEKVKEELLDNLNNLILLIENDLVENVDIAFDFLGDGKIQPCYTGDKSIREFNRLKVADRYLNPAMNFATFKS